MARSPHFPRFRIVGLRVDGPRTAERTTKVPASQLGTEAWWAESPADEWSDVIVAAMKLGGVDNLFFVSGSELNFYQEAIAKAHAKRLPAPRLVTMTHENVALNAALGNAMARNAPAATAVHVDVGTLHSGAALHTAWRGDYPVLMTAGTGPRAFPRSMPGARDNLIQWAQEPRDQGEIVRQYTKIDHRLEHLDNPGLIVSRLLQVAMSEPKGPVYLAIPQETAMLPVAGTARFPTRDQLGVARPAWPDPADAKTIATWLIKGDDPCIYSTRLGRDPEAVVELVRLAEFLAVPFMESRLADRMNFPAASFLYGTGPEPKDSDALLILDDVAPYIPGERSPSPDAHIAWVSADPVLSRYKTVEYRADLWIPASASAVLRAVYEAATTLVSANDRERITRRRRRLEDRKRDLVSEENALAEQSLRAGDLNGRVVGFELARLLEPASVILNDGVSNAEHVRTYARRNEFGTYFRSGSSSGGWGSGAAFGVKLANQDRDVVLVSGDGYYTFGSPLPALWAASNHRAAFLAIVLVNGTFSTGTSSLRRTYPGGFGEAAGFEGGRFDPAPDFAKLAEAANGYGERVTELAQLAAALRRGFDHIRDDTPAVIAVDVAPPVHLTPRG